jgi:hypothetical protein
VIKRKPDDTNSKRKTGHKINRAEPWFLEGLINSYLVADEVWVCASI